MNKILQLKISAIMLFWFGVIFESIVVIGFSAQYFTQGFIEQLTVFPTTLLPNIVNFTWLLLAHVMHIVAAFFLSKGSRKGAVFALIVCGWETIGFLIFFQSVLLDPSGVAIRIFFAIIIILIISGRKEITKLQTENWRPWKNPFTINREKTHQRTNL